VSQSIEHPVDQVRQEDVPTEKASRLDPILEHPFGLPAAVGIWHDPDLGRPIAAPLERCAELLGVDLATIRELAANVEPYVRPTAPFLSLTP
jgi:hypothetical protein